MDDASSMRHPLGLRELRARSRRCGGPGGVDRGLAIELAFQGLLLRLARLRAHRLMLGVAGEHALAGLAVVIAPGFLSLHEGDEGVLVCGSDFASDGSLLWCEPGQRVERPFFAGAQSSVRLQNEVHLPTDGMLLSANCSTEGEPALNGRCRRSGANSGAS